MCLRSSLTCFLTSKSILQSKYCNHQRRQCNYDAGVLVRHPSATPKSKTVASVWVPVFFCSGAPKWNTKFSKLPKFSRSLAGAVQVLARWIAKAYEFGSSPLHSSAILMRFGCPSNHNTRKHKFTEPAEDPQSPQTRNPKSTPALQEKPDAVKVVGILLIAHSIKEDADFVILGSREQEFSDFQNRVPIGMLGFQNLEILSHFRMPLAVLTCSREFLVSKDDILRNPIIGPETLSAQLPHSETIAQHTGSSPQPGRWT